MLVELQNETIIITSIRAAWRLCGKTSVCLENIDPVAYFTKEINRGLDN